MATAHGQIGKLAGWMGGVIHGGSAYGLIGKGWCCPSGLKKYWRALQSLGDGVYFAPANRGPFV